MSRRTRKHPEKGVIRDQVCDLNDSELSSLIRDLRFSTRLDQAALAEAEREQRRRKRRKAASTPA
ncbi:hypothetical protein [Marilutibacter alkalisoli]|uniref:Uncharacterized protein n=1 Tax=Marilutibacter alkalisoli TaxID=2591633 RepID=A0A514BU35_9GAMM|nr:hypothetical protein [Lysobacter alkalisoli]QDH70886.1 hypothetical protein FKV23_12915 [Lysobacter alkalisoli]